MSYFKINLDAKLNLSKLTSIITKFDTISQMVDETAAEVVSDIKNNIQTRGVVDTGALLDSIKHKTSGETAIIQDGVEYGFYNEFGTYKMPARPFFVPGVEQWSKIIGGRLDRIMI